MPVSLANRIAADVAAVVSDKVFQASNIDPFGIRVGTETPEAFRSFLLEGSEIQRRRVGRRT